MRDHPGTRGGVEKARAGRRRGPEEKRKLFDFDVVSGVHLQFAVGDKHCGSVVTDVDDHAFADHFSWQVIPLVLYRGAAEAVHLVLIIGKLDGRLRRGTLVAEDAEIIAHLHSLVGAEIDINDGVLAVGLCIVRAPHHHADRLAADGCETIEFLRRLVGRGRSVHDREGDVATLQIIARKLDYACRDVWLNVYNFHLAGVPIAGAHGLQKLALPFEPGNFVGILHLAHNGEAVADANALRGTSTDEYVIASGENNFVIGFFARNEPNFVGNAVIGEETGAIHSRVIGGSGFGATLRRVDRL